MFTVTVFAPVHGSRIDLDRIFPPSVKHFDPLFAHGIGISQQLGDHLLLNNTLGDIPLWIENDRLHRIGKNRCRVLGSAHDSPDTLYQLSVFFKIKHKIRDIDDNMTFGMRHIEPFDAIQVKQHGLDAFVYGFIEHGKGQGTYFSVILQSVAQLEMFHGFLQTGIIHRSLITFITGHIIPCSDQTFTQHRDSFRTFARPQCPVQRDHAPTAVGFDLSVFCHLLLQRPVMVLCRRGILKFFPKICTKCCLFQHGYGICLRSVQYPFCTYTVDDKVRYPGLKCTPIDAPQISIIRIGFIELGNFKLQIHFFNKLSMIPVHILYFPFQS